MARNSSQVLVHPLARAPELGNKLRRGGAASVSALTTPANQVLEHTDVPVAQVAAQGKDFNWIRPKCGCGRKKVWGHGYVTRFFEGFALPLWLKRYRCPGCGTVFTMIPASFARRYQSPAATIWSSIGARLTSRSWPRGLPRQRGGHWLRKFLAVCRMDFPDDDPMTVWDRLRGNGIHLF